MEALRQPLEDNVVSITRAKGSAVFPANFILIAAMNPCPCGNFGSRKECVCTPSQLDKYKRKISGPIMDRIDIHLEVSEIDHEKLSDSKKGENSENVARRINIARQEQSKRYGDGAKANSDLSAKELDKFVPLTEEVKDLLVSSSKKLGLSARAYHRVMKIARTIADLDSSKEIKETHILEALQYRPKSV